MKLSYTLSRNESNTNTALEGVGSGGVAGATNAFDFDEDYGPTSSDIRYSLAIDGVTTSAARPSGLWRSCRAERSPMERRGEFHRARRRSVLRSS